MSVSCRRLWKNYQRTSNYFIFLNDNQLCLRQHQQIITALKQCSRTGEVELGKRIHQPLKKSGADFGLGISKALINMYTRCGDMRQAREIFNNAARKDVVTWTCLLLGYVNNGESLKALELFDCMDCNPDEITYVAVLKACTALATRKKSERPNLLKKGAAIHNEVKKRGITCDTILTNSLLDMYSKCGNMSLARNIFDSMEKKDVVSWTSLILGYVDSGDCSEALELFTSMDCAADHVTYVAALKACGELAARRGSDKQTVLEKGLAIHEQLKLQPFSSNIFAASTLVDMYCKCGAMQLARKVFDELTSRSVVTWSCIISGYVENGDPAEAVKLFDCMDCEPSPVTFIAALKACASLAGERKDILVKGVSLHEKIKSRQLNGNLAVASALIDMYSRCEEMKLARKVFDELPSRDLVTWTCLILGYVENSESLIAVELFERMDCLADHVACTAALRACSRLAGEKEPRALEKGEQVHKVVKKLGLESNFIVATTLVELYSRCGKMELAREVFERVPGRDVVTWTCLIQGYVENGEEDVALSLFESMDCEPSHVTFVAAIKACTSLASVRGSETCTVLEKGISLHKRLKVRGYDSNLVVSNSLINMYCKCKEMRLAREVFESMTSKDVFSWTSIITGYVENGESWAALELFGCMDCKPNHVTYVVTLKACGIAGALQRGRGIHGTVCILGLEGDTAVATTLVDFYSRCGAVTYATLIFNTMPTPDIISWNALISGYSSLGDTFRVFDMTRQVLEAGFQLDAVSFVSLLSACSHAGLVEEAKVCFRGMEKHGVKPSVEHYSCMVDMLGRANRLEEAASVVKNMPGKVDEVTWTTLLGACRRWSNRDVAKGAFEALLSGNKSYWASAHVLMSGT